MDRCFILLFLILFAGIAYRIYEYATIPAPLKIPTPPAPKTKKGVAVRIFREVVFFESLFHSANGHGYLDGYFTFTLSYCIF